ncbi:MAG: DUF924 family protein [Pseudomonadota bacterium]
MSDDRGGAVGSPIGRADDEAAPDDWAEAVLAYWFVTLTPADWFKRSEVVDTDLTERFADVHAFVARQPEDALLTSARIARAAIIVLDQLPRNMFRGDARAFATDHKALSLASRAIALGFDQGLTADEALFVFLPFEHSESFADQHRAVALISELGNAVYAEFAVKHRDVIERFGRFPHRNTVLGRETTPEEQAYLSSCGGFG